MGPYPGSPTPKTTSATHWEAVSLHSRPSVASLRSNKARINAPAVHHHSKSLRNLSGTWSMSKTLSTGVPAALQIQVGYSTALRKAILTSPTRLTITQSHYPSQLYVRTQTLSAAHALPPPPPTTERWYPPQNVGRWSVWVDNIVYVSNFDADEGYAGGGGEEMLATKSRCRWVKGSQLQADADGRGGGGGGGDGSDGHGYLVEGLGRFDEYLEAEITCERAGWRTRQIWYMEEGKLIRRVVTFDLRGSAGGKEKGVQKRRGSGNDDDAVVMVMMSSDGDNNHSEKLGHAGRNLRRAETRWVYEFEG